MRRTGAAKKGDVRRARVEEREGKAAGKARVCHHCMVRVLAGAPWHGEVCHVVFRLLASACYPSENTGHSPSVQFILFFKEAHVYLTI